MKAALKAAVSWMTHALVWVSGFSGGGGGGGGDRRLSTNNDATSVAT